MSRRHDTSTQTFDGFADDSAAFGKRLRRLSEVIDQDSKRLYKHLGIEFEQRWFGVINQLLLQGPMPVGAIAEALGITHASVSETRSSLQKAGLVRSQKGELDGRQRLLSLTPKAHTLIDETRPLWEAMERCSQELNAEAGDVAGILDRLAEALDRQSLFERVLADLEEPERELASGLRSD